MAKKIWPIPDDQSADARRDRLRGGLCPIHAMPMTQIDGWFLDDRKRKFTVVGCVLNDCRARARMYSSRGPWELLEECADLAKDP